MNRLDLFLLAVLWVGTTLVLGEFRQMRRAPLVERLRPYAPVGAPRSEHSSATSAVATVLAPLAETFGGRLARAAGMSTELSVRLSRAGVARDPVEFRVRQFTLTLVALAAAAGIAMATAPAPPVALLLVLGVPLLVALAVEHDLERRTTARAAEIDAELPVVAEQLGILLGAGLSLNAALGRLAGRGHGVIATDLGAVVRGIRHGRSERQALRDWSDAAGVDAIERLVAVLSLHREASDLGALISEEAIAIREATHRRLVASIERRAQLVWVPVTVATLVPGLILIGVPFVSAMNQVTG